MALLNFDATQVAPDQGFEVLPSGWYNVMIDDSEVKPTKAEGGLLLNLRFSILDGDFKGRKLFARFNIRNANAVAQEIAYKQLSAVAHAVGVLRVGDSQELHGKPLKIKIKLRKGNQDPTKGELYEDSNDVTTYRNINDAVGDGNTAATALHQHAASQPVAAGFAAQPWAQPSAVSLPTATAQPTTAQVVPTAPPTPAVPQAVAPPPIKRMTAKAQGATYESFIANHWTDEMMVNEGYLELVMPTVPAAPVVPAAPAVPAAPIGPSVGPAVGAAASLTPPWMQTK